MPDRDVPTSPDAVRSALPDLEGHALEAEKIHRMILGVDEAPRAMADGEVETELNDPFALLLLRRGTFPATFQEVLGGIAAATKPDDPLRTQMSFIVGEGSQIPWSPETASLQRGLRLALSLGRGTEIEVLVSSAPRRDDPGVFLQVMGWDDRNGVFHYYERKGGVWVWAGNSTHALDPVSRGQGPFDSHVNGSMVMKELKPPWNHWHSVDATVPPEVFAPDDPFRTDPLFVQKSGGEVFQLRVVQPGVQRWTKSRFAKSVTPGGVEQLRALMEQLFTTTTVNLVSTTRESRVVEPGEQLVLPPSFFADVDMLVGTLGLAPPPALAVPGDIYLGALERFDVALTDGEFRQPGDTHFAFLVPERAFEDLDVVAKCVEAGVLTDRFVGCATMVDFSNPVFAPRRAALLAHVPDRADSAAAVSDTVAKAIEDAAGGAPGGPEQEFMELWQLGDEGWRAEGERRLAELFTAVAAQLQTAEGFDGIFMLAESRRRAVEALDLSEGRPLLFADTNIPEDAPPLRMQPDGAVVVPA